MAFLTNCWLKFHSQFNFYDHRKDFFALIHKSIPNHHHKSWSSSTKMNSFSKKSTICGFFEEKKRPFPSFGIKEATESDPSFAKGEEIDMYWELLKIVISHKSFLYIDKFWLVVQLCFREGGIDDVIRNRPFYLGTEICCVQGGQDEKYQNILAGKLTWNNIFEI